MFRERDNNFKKLWISLFRLLIAITMLQYLVAGAIPSLAAPATEPVQSAVNGLILSPTVAYQLTVSKPGSGTGTVTSDPTGIDCGVTCSFNFEESTVVTLTAVVDTGSTFTGWSGEGCTGTGTCVVNMGTADKSVTATFEETVEVTGFDLMQSVN